MTQALNVQQLLPSYIHSIDTFNTLSKSDDLSFSDMQPRLAQALNLFCHKENKQPFMLLKAAETPDHLYLIQKTIEPKFDASTKVFGSRYHIQQDTIVVDKPRGVDDEFAVEASCDYYDWIEAEELFGCVRYHNDEIELEPGVIHKNNGGMIILSVRTLLAQPLMWQRLKKMVTERCFQWLSPDEKKPLPLKVPNMPLSLKLILVGDRMSLADFQEIEPELFENGIYGELEAERRITNNDDLAAWCQYVNHICDIYALPYLTADAWPHFIRLGARYTGDQNTLPLCPQWIMQQLQHSILFSCNNQLTGEQLQSAISQRQWRENYLPERLHNDFLQQQVLVETQGEVVGQINGLSVVEYPGHPVSFGEPSRISCVVHLGEGEVTDVERKAELAGSLHAKGMMIMQAFLMSELALEQQCPFSASLVFEQSYSEVDGDSASLAELSALISALSTQPLKQSIAVTGSVDQFGHVQPIGGVNEKIEGFFKLCQARGLDGSHGVIIPQSNQQHLCLSDEIIDAVSRGLFTIYPVEHVAQAMPILTGMPLFDDKEISLLSLIQQRIAQANANERPRLPWLFRWLNWFNQS